MGMAERDPFGRLPDENPLAGLGSLSDGIESQQPAQPVVSGRHEQEREDRPPPPPREDGPSRPEKPRAATTSSGASSQQETLRNLLGAVEQLKRAKGDVPGVPVMQTIGRVVRIVRVIFVLAIVVAIGSVALGIFSTGAVRDNIGDPIRDRISEQIPDIQELEDTFGEQAKPSAAEPAGLSKGSLLVQRNLAPALRRMRTSGLGRLKFLSIRAERIDAQLLTKGGRLRSVQQRFDGNLKQVSVSGGAGFGQLQTIPFKRANSAAPGRLTRSAAGRVEQPVSQVDYVVLINTGADAVWTIVMKSGAQFLGDARGRITRRIG